MGDSTQESYTAIVYTQVQMIRHHTGSHDHQVNMAVSTDTILAHRIRSCIALYTEHCNVEDTVPCLHLTRTVAADVTTMSLLMVDLEKRQSCDRQAQIQEPMRRFQEVNSRPMKCVHSSQPRP